jgi:hypothetical protein
MSFSLFKTRDAPSAMGRKREVDVLKIYLIYERLRLIIFNELKFDVLYLVKIYI